jgi:hypothetical protein
MTSRPNCLPDGTYLNAAALLLEESVIHHLNSVF